MRLKPVTSPLQTNRLAAAVYAPLLAYLLYSSWLRWPDALVDFGYFLYNAWSVSEGALPGVGISYFYGPLPILVLGKAFALFGASIWLVYAVNFVLLIASLYLVHRYFRSFSAASAILAGTCFLAIAAASQFIFEGNYNLMAPYKPEAAWGGFLLLLLANVGKEKPELGSPHGLLLGALFLVSTESALAGIAVAGICLLSTPWRGRATLHFLLGTLALPLLCFLYFRLHTDTPTVLRAVFRSFLILGNTSLVFAPLLRELMGIDEPIRRLAVTFGVGGAVAFLAAIYWAVARAAKAESVRSPTFWGLVALLPLALLAAGAVNPFWLLFPKCLLLPPLLGLAYWLLARRERIALGIWAALSLALLVRMLLNPMLHYYGFSLATFSALLLFPLFHDILPARWPGRGALGWRAFAWSLGLAVLAAALLLRAPFFAHKDFPVSAGKDPLYDWNSAVSPRGPALKELLDFLRTELRPGDSVLGLPDGHMVNYLLRAPRPRPYSLSLGDITETSEDRILETYRAAKPRFVFLTEKESYDAPGGFGDTYGAAFLPWVDNEYRPLREFGQPIRFRLYERK